MPIHHPSLVPQLDTLDPKNFFEEVVAGAIATRVALSRALEGACRITVTGDGGGVWCIDLSAGEVDSDEAKQVDLEIAIEKAWLEPLLTGKRKLQEALSAGTFEAKGDARMFDKLSLLLAP